MYKHYLNILFFFSFLVFNGQQVKEIQLIEKKIKLVIQPNVGGRISQLFYNNIPVFSSENKEVNDYGSVWWPSPQSEWGWPPPKVLNIGNYTFEKNGKSINLISEICEQTNIILDKTYTLISENHVQILYTVTNKSHEDIQFGHWEVTRLPKGGIVLFPAGKLLLKSEMGKNKNYLYVGPNFEGSKIFNDSLKLFNFEILNNTKSFENGAIKLFANGKNGWSAYIRNDILFVKVFKDVPLNNIPPNQGEIEVYITKEKSFIELEQHSEYITLKPNNSSKWICDWLVTDEFPKGEQSLEILKSFIENYIQKNKLQLR